MAQQWQFLVLNITYRDNRREVIDFVSANYRPLFHYVLQEALEGYLEQLFSDGWQLTRTQTMNDGRDEAYYFRLPLV